MELIRNNPYRIAGILSNATERELQKQKAKIKAFSKVGKEIKSEYDFEFLDSITRTETSIDRAFSCLEQNQDKVDNAIFWFLNASPFDNTAIEYLKSGNRAKAIEIWEKVTLGKDMNSKNFSAFTNLGTLRLLGPSREDIKSGIEFKIKLIESDFFKVFVRTVADETLAIDPKKQSEKLIDDFLTSLNGRFSTTETLDFFSNCNGITQKYLTQKFTSVPISKIENKIETTKRKRKANKKMADEYGIKLFEECKDDLAALKSILGINDLKYKLIADNMAKEVMQCGVDYFIEWKDIGDPIERSQTLLRYAKSIATGSQTIEGIESNINGIEEFKHKEFTQAIALLQSIKEAYKKNESQIMSQVRMQESKLEYGQRINWDKVNDMVKNSLDWNVVVELILENIPPENANKIKILASTVNINHYKNLVDFVIGKLSYSQINQVKYLCFWKLDNRTSRFKFTLQSLPLWAKWLIGIALITLIAGLIWGMDGVGLIIGGVALFGFSFVLNKLREY